MIDLRPGSPLSTVNYSNLHNRDLFPIAFSEGTIGGTYGPQHTLDMVGWPLFKYRGFYADVGIMQIGDIDRLWNATIGDPKSPYDIHTRKGAVHSRTTLSRGKL